MSLDISMLRAKLRKALDNYGKTNGHACPPSASNIDPLFHELYITSEAASYFKTRYERARDMALSAAFDHGVIDKAVAKVLKNQQGDALVAPGGDLYMMTVDISRPANKLDQTALRNALVTKHGLTLEQVNKLFDDSTTYATPAKRIKVMARG